MDIENITALLKERVYEQSLEDSESNVPQGIADEVATEANPHQHQSDFPWLDRQAFSPPTMGYPLPYLDVISIQSKRLLPLTRKELDALRKNTVVREHNRTQEDDPAVEDSGENTDHDSFDSRGDDPLIGTSEPPLVDFDAILRSVRLLAEPLAIPDLTHTGVKCQFANCSQELDTIQAFQVTAPNHSFDETQVKLFYPTGAKNANMREYIKDTIQKHMTPLKSDGGDDPTHKADSPLASSQSMPTLASTNAGATLEASTSPAKSIPKKKAKAYYSPTKTSSPKKSTSGSISSGARLSGSISTSKLLNPELTRQAKDILAQIRANSTKINDLIGS